MEVNLSLTMVAAAMAPPGPESPQRIRIDFGKHKGELIADLPDSYLNWLSRRRQRFPHWASIADKIIEERHRRCTGKELGSEVPMEQESACLAIGLGNLGIISLGSESATCQDVNSQNVGSERVEAKAEALEYSGERRIEAVALKHIGEAGIKRAEANASEQACEAAADLEFQALETSGEEPAICSGEADGKPAQRLVEFEQVAVRDPIPEILTAARGEEISSRRHMIPLGFDDRKGLEELFSSFERRTDPTGYYAEFITWCGNTRAVDDGRSVHEHIMNSERGKDTFLLNLLVEMYGRWGKIKQARSVFNGIEFKNIFSWNRMLEAYIQADRQGEAIELYHRMDLEGCKPDRTTYLSIIRISSTVEQLVSVQERLEDSGLDTDAHVLTSLVRSYGNCGCFEQARAALERIRYELRDETIWTSSIEAFNRSGNYDQALELYYEMILAGVEPGPMTFCSVLHACERLASRRPKLENLDHGRAVHAAVVEAGLETNGSVATSLVSMYGQYLELDIAASIFRTIQYKDLACWNTVIRIHIFNHCSRQAVELFKEMQMVRVSPDAETFNLVLTACRLLGLAYRDFLTCVHRQILSSRLESDSLLGSSLVKAYTEFGMLEEAREVLDRMKSHTANDFDRMILGYFHQKNASEVLTLFWTMQLEGLRPSMDSINYSMATCQRPLPVRYKQYLESVADHYGMRTAMIR